MDARKARYGQAPRGAIPSHRVHASMLKTAKQTVNNEEFSCE